eukprot:3176843-Pleurochrysis_carterae.AAC.2
MAICMRGSAIPWTPSYSFAGPLFLPFQAQSSSTTRPPSLQEEALDTGAPCLSGYSEVRSPSTTWLALFKSGPNAHGRETSRRLSRS